MSTCGLCQFDPCSCRYITGLLRNEDLRRLALLRMRQPLHTPPIARASRATTPA